MGRSDEPPGDTNSDGLNGHGFPRKHTYKYDEIWWFCMVQRHVYIGEFWGELTIQNLHLEAMNENLKSLVVAVFFQSLLLVGGLEHEFYVPCHIWVFILPIDELHHFSRWLKRTTNQIGFPIPQHNGIPNPDKLSVFGSFWKRRAGVSATIQIPIGSMYGIYANIRGILMVNVTIYSIHGSYGIEYD